MIPLASGDWISLENVNGGVQLQTSTNVPRKYEQLGGNKIIAIIQLRPNEFRQQCEQMNLSDCPVLMTSIRSEFCVHWRRFICRRRFHSEQLLFVNNFAAGNDLDNMSHNVARCSLHFGNGIGGLQKVAIPFAVTIVQMYFNCEVPNEAQSIIYEFSLTRPSFAVLPFFLRCSIAVCCVIDRFRWRCTVRIANRHLCPVNLVRPSSRQATTTVFQFQRISSCVYSVFSS